MRYLGAAVIPVLLSVLSAAASFRIRRRARILETTYMMLNEMKLTFEYACLPMYETVSRLNEKSSYSETFIPECKRLLDSGTDFPAAWSASVSTAKGLSRDEKQKLLQLGGLLGTSDLGSQLSVMDMYIRSFDEYRKEARLVSKKYADTCLYAGLFCALGIFVMLI